jgi:hypothetical protein
MNGGARGRAARQLAMPARPCDRRCKQRYEAGIDGGIPIIR